MKKNKAISTVITVAAYIVAMLIVLPNGTAGKIYNNSQVNDLVMKWTGKPVPEISGTVVIAALVLLGLLIWISFKIFLTPFLIH